MKSLPDLLHPEFNDVFEDTKTPRGGRPALTGALVEFMFFDFQFLEFLC